MRCLCSLALLGACGFGSPSNGDDGGDSDGSGSGGEWVMLEELTIPVNDLNARTLSSVLEAGVGYRLRASGTFFVTSVGRLGDAEYYNFNVGDPVDADVGIDVGLAVNDSVVDGIRTPRWGTYNEQHVYEVPWIGAGERLVIQLHDGNYDDNSGMLKLAILVRR